MLLISPLCGETCALHLDTDTQLDDAKYIFKGGVGIGVKVAIGSVADERAYAVFGYDQPTGLQLRNGFAHKSSADAILGHDLRFCRQFLPGLQCAVGDSFAQRMQLSRRTSGA